MKADFNQNYINYFTGQHKSDEYTKINPHATVPAATDGDLTITESVSSRSTNTNHTLTRRQECNPHVRC
jgi:hypothetical protein